MKIQWIIITAGVGIAMLAHGQALTNPSSPFTQNAPDPFTQSGVAQNARCGPQGNGDYILCEGVGGLIHETQANFAAFLHELYILAFILAGTVAFVRIVYGGVLYSWSGVIDQKKKAIDIFKHVAIGMALLMGSYVLLNTINPALTILQLPSVNPNIKMGISGESSPASTIAPTPEEKAATLKRAMQLQDEQETQANLDLINYEIYKIEDAGGPKTPAEEKRLGELNALKDAQAKKDQSDAAKMLFAP